MESHALPPPTLVSLSAVTQKAAGTSNIVASLLGNCKLLLKSPKTFLGNKAYLAVAIVYSGTYLTANTVMTLCEHHRKDPTYFKLFSVAAVNMGLGVTKDSLFARWFGQAGKATGACVAYGMCVVGCWRGGAANVHPLAPARSPRPLTSWTPAW